MSQSQTAAPFPILVVEDNLIDFEITMRSLKRAGVGNPIVHVKDGTLALDYLQGQGQAELKAPSPPGFILLDLHLPRLSGWEVLQVLQADPALNQIPVIIMASSERDIEMVKAIGNDAYRVAFKPLEFTRLLEIVQSLKRFQLTFSHRNERRADPA